MKAITDDNKIKEDLNVNWHPFMQMKDFENHPPKRIIRAEGLTLFSEDSWYYDTISSWWCNILGHCHPKISSAVKLQLDTLDHIMFGNFTHDPAIELSKKLVKITPKGLDRVYYSDNGSTAIEVALKMSLHYWVNMGHKNKTNLLFFNGSYHGDTIGTMSVSGVSQYNEMFRPLMFNSIQMPDPSMDEAHALFQLEATLHQQSEDIAAVVIEPLLMGAGGMKITSPDFLKNVRHLTKKYQVHLISDEVATGFGRTGRLFASNHADITPDFMCLSKALTNGQLPLAVTMLTNEIYQAFYADFKEGKTFYHGHTFTANPIGCAVANATLDVLDEWDWTINVDAIHKTLNSELNILNDQFNCISNPRTIGTVGAVDINLPGDRAMFKLSQIGFENHLTIRPLRNTIYLYLPLITSQDELSDIFKHLSNTINKALNC